MQHVPGPPPVVEKKVRAATAAAWLGTSVLLYVLELIRDVPVLATPLPDFLEPILVALIPSAIVFVAGYMSRHTPRPDLPGYGSTRPGGPIIP